MAPNGRRKSVNRLPYKAPYQPGQPFVKTVPLQLPEALHVPRARDAQVQPAPGRGARPGGPGRCARAGLSGADRPLQVPYSSVQISNTFIKGEFRG